jgi:hypothetical protein
MSILYVHDHVYRVFGPSAQRTNYFPPKNAIAIRWLKAISHSEKREFCNFVPPLNDEAFQVFVQFFWFVKLNDRQKALQLVCETRRKWYLEGWFYEYMVNKFLEDTAFISPAVSYWDRNPCGEARGVVRPKAVSYENCLIRLAAIKGRQLTLLLLKARSRKTPKVVKHKSTVNRPFSSTITKRPATAQLGFKKKRRLGAKARSSKSATVNQGKRHGW